METKAHYTVVGAFVMAVVIGIFVAIVWLTRLQFEKEGRIYDINFRGSVSGLNDGAPVRYKGVLIGRVMRISLDPDNVERIRVRIVVDTGTPIKQDAVASLEAQGITGLAYVEISGGSNASPVVEVPEGHQYPLINSKPSQLEEVVRSAPELLNRIIQVADRVTLFLSDDNRQSITETLKNVDTMTGAIAKRSDEVERFVSEASATMAEAHQTVATASAMLGRLNKSLLDKDGIGDRLTLALDDLDRSVKTLGQVSHDLDAIMLENRAAIRDFAQRGLGEAEKLVVDWRTLTAELNRIADQLDRDPARFLFGNRREGYKPQ